MPEVTPPRKLPDPRPCSRRLSPPPKPPLPKTADDSFGRKRGTRKIVATSLTIMGEPPGGGCSPPPFAPRNSDPCRCSTPDMSFDRVPTKPFSGVTTTAPSELIPILAASLPNAANRSGFCSANARELSVAGTRTQGPTKNPVLSSYTSPASRITSSVGGLFFGSCRDGNGDPMTVAPTRFTEIFDLETAVRTALAGTRADAKSSRKHVAASNPKAHRHSASEVPLEGRVCNCVCVSFLPKDASPSGKETPFIWPSMDPRRRSAPPALTEPPPFAFIIAVTKSGGNTNAVTVETARILNRAAFGVSKSAAPIAHPYEVEEAPTRSGAALPPPPPSPIGLLHSTSTTPRANTNKPPFGARELGSTTSPGNRLTNMEGASRVRRSTKNGSLTRAGCVGSNKGDMRIKSRGSLVTGSGGSNRSRRCALATPASNSAASASVNNPL
mmetsp:Transcript_1957/g.7523  ORF Transcript_1957/g.7523 Transcript_1957/m.7523 type:complete len:442 (+) Transcript_1957:1249-2574(+)